MSGTSKKKLLHSQQRGSRITRNWLCSAYWMPWTL